MTRLFIASSTEGRPYAQAVAAVLARQGVHVVPLDAPVAPFSGTASNAAKSDPCPSCRR
jgi:3-hydroxyisobutyrate dehydrogenase-like beta-hydroxyacid dehydrogenase